MADDINWYDKALDWAWTLLVGAGLWLISLIRRIYRNDARLHVLEGAAEDRAKQLRALDEKIDKHNDKMINAVNAMHQEIAAERKENNDNHRLVINELLQRVPRA